jgi:hypothetical protein
VKDRYGKPERGSEWEPIKIFLEGGRGSNKMKTTSNTRLRLNYPSWSRPRSHWSATDPRNKQQPSEPTLTNTHIGNLHGLLPVLHRLDRWPAPVRPVDRASQAGAYNSRTKNVPESLCDFSSPRTKHPQNSTCTEEEPYTKPTKTPPKLPRTDQHQHNVKTHGFSNSPEANPTKGTHRSDWFRAPVRPV